VSTGMLSLLYISSRLNSSHLPALHMRAQYALAFSNHSHYSDITSRDCALGHRYFVHRLQRKHPVFQSLHQRNDPESLVLDLSQRPRRQSCNTLHPILPARAAGLPNSRGLNHQNVQSIMEFVLRRQVELNIAGTGLVNHYLNRRARWRTLHRDRLSLDQLQQGELLARGRHQHHVDLDSGVRYWLTCTFDYDNELRGTAWHVDVSVRPNTDVQVYCRGYVDGLWTMYTHGRHRPAVLLASDDHNTPYRRKRDVPLWQHRALYCPIRQVGWSLRGAQTRRASSILPV